MAILNTIGHFFLSEWIWSVTWGFYHIPCNIIIMIILFKFFLRINMVSAVFTAITAQLFAFVIFTLVTLGIMLLLGQGGGPESFLYVPNTMPAFFYLGLIYAFLQSIFFDLISHRHAIHLSWFIVIAIISNNLTVLITYLFSSLP